MSKIISISAVLAIALMPSCSKKNACHEVVAEISGNHGHALALTGDDVGRGKSGDYALKGGTHEHVVNIGDDEMKKLGAGEPIERRSSSVNGHMHAITLSCK